MQSLVLISRSRQIHLCPACDAFSSCRAGLGARVEYFYALSERLYFFELFLVFEFRHVGHLPIIGYNLLNPSAMLQ